MNGLQTNTSQSQKQYSMNNSYFNSELRQRINEMDNKNIKNSFQGYGLSLIQSPSTLQKSIILHQFSKSKRFYQYDDHEDVQFPLLPQSLSKRATSLGYGKKYLMNKEQIKIAEINPSPNTYQKADFKINFMQGKSFGLSHEYYKKMDMPNENPGPGNYNTLQKYPSDKPKIVFKGKKDFQLKKLITPSPCYYDVNHSQIFNKKFFLYNLEKVMQNCINNQVIHREVLQVQVIFFNVGPSDYNNLYIHKTFDKYLKNKKQFQKSILKNSSISYEKNQ